jgi:integrase
LPIRRHGSGWEARIQRGGRRISKTFRSRRDAAEFERRTVQRLEDHRVGRTPQYSLEEALVRWLTGEAALLKDQTGIRSLLRAMEPYVAGRTLNEVADVAEKVKAACIAKGLAPAPINRRLAVLKRVAKLAYKRWGWLENDLGAKIELLPGEKQRSEWVTPAEAKRLIQCAKGPIREAIRWAVLTGLRRGEILAIRPENFKGGGVYLPDSKSGKPRTVPVPGELDPKRFPYGLHPTALSKGFQDARRLARLPHIRFHDLRRTFATWLINGRADISVVRDLLGHSTISMTSRYLGANMELMAKAMSNLPSLRRRSSR